MNQKDFAELLDRRIAQMRETLDKKSAEYSTEDKLHNFKAAAALDGETPEQALWGMVKKHLVAVIDAVGWTAKDGDARLTREFLDEKIGDCINYFVLLEALFVERIDAGNHVYIKPFPWTIQWFEDGSSGYRTDKTPHGDTPC